MTDPTPGVRIEDSSARRAVNPTRKRTPQKEVLAMGAGSRGTQSARKRPDFEAPTLKPEATNQQLSARNDSLPPARLLRAIETMVSGDLLRYGALKRQRGGIALLHLYQHVGRSDVGTSGLERRRRCVFERELDGLGGCLVG